MRLLTRHEAILVHQPGHTATPDPVAVVDKIPVHPRTAIGAVRQGEGRSDMRKADHVLPLIRVSHTASHRNSGVGLFPFPIEHLRVRQLMLSTCSG